MGRSPRKSTAIQVLCIQSNHDWNIIYELFKNIRFVRFRYNDTNQLVRDNCWVRGTDSTIYTTIKYDGKKIPAHKLSYELFTGKKILNWGCHHCDTKACINPNHIFDGTARQNHWDAMRKHRSFNIRIRK